MGAATVERAKASARNVRIGTYLTDGESLYEVVNCHGVKVLKAGPTEIPVIEQVRLVDVSKPVPYMLRADLKQGAWVPFEEVLSMHVVVPA